MKNILLRHKRIVFLSTLSPIIFLFMSCKDISKLDPIRVVTELNIGEIRNVKLSNGDIVKLKLIQIDVIRDSLRDAIREAKVKISINNEEFTLNMGNYNLPVVAGNVQIDFPAFKGLCSNTDKNHDRWGLNKDARFRLWPKKSPYIQQGTFIYPIKQVWFASMSQSGNEPCYVDWGESPANKIIYYHSGHDIGGAEALDEIVSATDGLVLSSNNKLIPGYDSIPVNILYIRPDAVNVLDKRGWLVEYVHLDSIDPAIKPGVSVKMGQKIGYIGKQGSSGGWVHLHFQIATKYPLSGKWGIEDAYPYLWESYVNRMIHFY